MKKQYELKKINKETYEIVDMTISSNKVMMYLLVGEKKAMLIDSGYGGLDLPAIVKTVTDLPVICVNTHGHLDHALGAYMFEESYLHSADVEVFKEHCTAESFEKIAYGNGVKILPKESFPKEYVDFVDGLSKIERPCPKPIEDVKCFDLGGRRVEWYHIPGHTQGSIALYDEKYNLLFDSDACGMGVWLFLKESSSLRKYRADLQGYYEYALSKGSPKRYVGHMKKPLKTSAIKKLLDCVDIAIEGKKEPKHIKLNFGDADLMFAKGGVMFYDKNHID